MPEDSHEPQDELSLPLSTPSQALSLFLSAASRVNTPSPWLFFLSLDAALKYVLKGKHGFVLCEDPRYLVPANTINIREVSVSQCNCRYPSYGEGPGSWFTPHVITVNAGERCIGALDGTHIPVTVSLDERPRYHNRKGDVSTNVLAACGPDLRFIYVLPGWEGSAGDSRVLRDALRHQNKLEIPTGKYFLVDVGYTNGPGFLAPYQGTRYHLNEWIGNTPQSYKELFNLRHASARNAIERNLGNKGDGGWKRSALNVAATVLSTSFNVNVTSDNVKNRIKLWRSWYGISHKSAKPFRFKVLQNLDDIVDLCAKDRATGHGAETAMDADEAMNRETNEVEFMGLGAIAIDLEEPSSNTKGKRQGSTSSGTHPHKRKMGEKEGIAASSDKMANSFNRMVEKMDGKVDDEDIQEVLREAALIPDLSRQQWAKAIKWLADDPKQLAIVKALPIHQKTDYVLTHLGE
ncbi:hypothetical protein D0Y65_046370 [Glycine soja]|nr:hypothetical protein D0Y65_046370 [Glycine soja]